MRRVRTGVATAARGLLRRRQQPLTAPRPCACPRSWDEASGGSALRPPRPRLRRYSTAAAAPPGLSPRLRARLEERLGRYHALVEETSSAGLSDGARRERVREMVELEAGAQATQRLHELEAEAASLESLQADEDAGAELQAMAAEELAEVSEERQAVEQTLLHSLLPKDAAEEGDMLLEIRAGAGGDEASIFAADLHDMYTRCAALRRARQRLAERCVVAQGGARRGLAVRAHLGDAGRHRHIAGGVQRGHHARGRARGVHHASVGLPAHHSLLFFFSKMVVRVFSVTAR